MTRTPRIVAMATWVLLSSRASLAEDCSTCTKDKLCELHVASHKAAGEEMRKASRNGNVSTRKDAIQAFGREVAAHSNCRPNSYLKLLVFFLSDLDLGVAAAAATALAETQDPGLAAMHLGQETLALRKQVENLKPEDAKSREEKVKRLEAFADGLVLTGNPGATGIAGLVASSDLDVMALGAVRCRTTRGAQMPKVVLEAIERCRTLPASGKRDQVCQDLVVSWEELTKSGIKSPISDARDPAEMDRWIGEARKWIGQYLKTWK